MSKYRIHINKQLPDDHTINSGKDFSKVLREYQQIHQPWWVLKNFHKNKRLRRLFILLFIILMTVYFTSSYFKEEQKQKEAEKNKTIQTGVVPKDTIW